MDWQLFLVGVLVSLALVYLGVRVWRAWRGRGAGCGGCKCSGTSNASSSAQTLVPVEQLRLRRR